MSTVKLSDQELQTVSDALLYYIEGMQYDGDTLEEDKATEVFKKVVNYLNEVMYEKYSYN